MTTCAEDIDAFVGIAGGGPVGMTVALELGTRGVPTIVFEQSLQTTTNPRCNTTNARSMEYFRRLGVADELRRAGLPLTHPTDVVYKTSLTGHELARFEFSSAQEILDGTAREYDDWPTPELQHRISQIYLEPILAENLRAHRQVRMLRGRRVLSVEPDGDIVRVVVENLCTGATETYRVRYLVGCDGGASVVRKSVGARLQGDDRVGDRRLSIYFSSDDVDLPGARAGWWYWWHGRRFHGAFIQLDGRSLYLCHARVPEGLTFDDMDPDEVLTEAIGRPIEHTKIDVVRWTPRRLVADHFVSGQVALAGDAAHIWLPMGGFGMNTGIADAVGVGWRLAAIYEGWGHRNLLSDYEFERRSVGEATSQAAKTIGHDLESISNHPELHDDTPQGEAIRARVGQVIREVDRKQWYSLGVQFGARYSGSQGIAHSTIDEAEAAITSIDQYQPSATPGARFPHYWLNPGKLSVFDKLGRDFSLVRVGRGGPPVEPLVAAAEFLGIPLRLVSLPDEAIEIYQQRLVLVRPDLVVAWSGNTCPEDPTGMLQRLCGHTREEAPQPPSTISEPVHG